ncbi:unnamed protein product [Heligmosomoides polygyrus]|uniref:Transposase n=1 Tax=Heligmosomoides polygyrus TaxID=6339 RepID=A0A183G654_HELPZ|nr:unnamed protein product [Heligmosomoides polygyrus]
MVDGWSYALGPRLQRHHTTEVGVVPIADKLREADLHWYGHVLRANNGTTRNTAGTLKSLESGPGDSRSNVG